jgi:beta-phosphoglucomutase-like phosphatase (HAD superfamily)
LERPIIEHKKLHIKGIILDLDGTIVDSRQAYLDAARTAFSAVGKHTFNAITVTEIPKRFEQDIPLDDLLPEIDLKKFPVAYLNAYDEVTAVKAKPLPHVRQSIKKL